MVLINKCCCYNLKIMLERSIFIPASRSHVYLDNTFCKWGLRVHIDSILHNEIPVDVDGEICFSRIMLSWNTHEIEGENALWSIWWGKSRNYV